MRRVIKVAVQLRLFTLIVALIACAEAPHAQPRSILSTELAELWQEPTDLLERDLFYGPGGAALAPPSSGATYEFVAFKTSGTNPGYDVKDASGRMWSVKLGIEAQPEVTASRILWAIGFHQPPQYFVHEFTLAGMDAGVKQTARFRTDNPQWKAAGDWSWYENPFMNSTPMRGLVVAQLILNNWDLKTDNNRLYEMVDPAAKPQRIYMVRDVGASLGHSRQAYLFKILGTMGSQGTKNDIDGFEGQGFIKKVDGNQVTFDYRGLNQELVDRVTVPDVIWVCELMARIPDGHWQAAFKAGAFAQADADRFIKKIKEKIAQGLALKTPAPTR
jgi:hypothetical protein